MDMERWAPSIDPFAAWIDQQNFDAAKLWASHLANGTQEQQEAAVAEAVAWDWLYERVDEIELAFDPTTRSADFACREGQASFLVEVTNISRSAMTAETGLPDTELFQGNYRSPADRLHHAILDKAKQGPHRPLPYLVLVTTLHRNGSLQLTSRTHLEWVLHSPEFLQGRFDPHLGEVVGSVENATDFRRAAFTRTRSLAGVRPHVSGALFGAFGLYPRADLPPARPGPTLVRGILNPEARQAFDPSWLPDAPFARFAEWPPRSEIEIRWTDEAPEPQVEDLPNPLVPGRRLWIP